MKLIVAAALTAFLIVGFLWARTVASQSTCEVIRDQIQRSLASMDDPRSPGFSYYQEHPAERETLIRTNQDFLDRLPC